MEDVNVETIEFSKEAFTLDEWLREMPEMIQATYNSFIRAIAKRTKLKFSQIRQLPYKKGSRLIQRFTEEHGLAEEYGFLGNK